MSDIPERPEHNPAHAPGREGYSGAWAAAATLVIAVALASGAVP